MQECHHVDGEVDGFLCAQEINPAVTAIRYVTTYIARWRPSASEVYAGMRHDMRGKLAQHSIGLNATY